LEPAFAGERERETCRLVWGTMEELASQLEAKPSM
jgi:hypothetical protein